MLAAIRQKLRRLGVQRSGAPGNGQVLEDLLANDYGVSFSQSYRQLESFDRRLGEYHGLLQRAHKDVSRIISKNDEMKHSKFNTDEVYLLVGRSALQLIISALIDCDLDRPQTILDLPCGHGREARYLRAAFPESTIYAGDIDLDGVKFCCETFDMLPIESKVSLDEVVFPTQFDTIWCGSLLTHFDSQRASALLNKLCEYLSPNGILLVTSHGRLHANFVHDRCFKLSTDEVFSQIRADYLRLGFGYADYPGHNRFGLSLTSPSWIAEYIYPRNDLILRSFSERAWVGLHDVAVIQKRNLDQDLLPSRP